MKQTKIAPTLEQRNAAVKAVFLAIMQETKELIATLPQFLLRHCIEMEDTPHPNSKAFKFITPLTYLCLRDSDKGLLIQFGFDTSYEYIELTSKFVRLIYKLTMVERTRLNIEDCVSSHCIITDTSYLFDEMEWKHPDTPVHIIAHKPATTPRKQRMAVA